MKIREIISQAATLVLFSCAILITALIVHREFFSSQTTDGDRIVENWHEISLLENSYNPDKETVQIIKFYDYECPYCKQVQSSLNAVKKKYESDLSIRYAHMPLSNHHHAYEAAIAVECAKNQGAFDVYHTLLFDYQNKLGPDLYSSLAEKAGVNNQEEFEKCLDNTETAFNVDEGLNLAESLGINSIPSFLINETLVVGALSEERLTGYIDEKIEKIENQ